MVRTPGVHLPTVAGRVRTDRGVLLLMGLVAFLTVTLTAAVAPATERAADRAIASTVSDAGPRADVVATLPEWYDDPRGKELDPSTAVQVGQYADYAESVLPSVLADVVRPGLTSVTTPPLQLLDQGPGRLLQLAYVDRAGEGPAVTWTSGGPPEATAGDGDDQSWPVQVGVSRAVADALGVAAGDRIPAKDEFGRTLRIDVSGVFVPDDPDDAAWQVSPRMLRPVQGASEGVAFTSAGALVTSDSLADLRFALPGDDLNLRTTFAPEPSRVGWRAAPALERAVVSLQSSAGLADGEIAWDSGLGLVLQDGRAQVASARGQGQLLVVGLVVTALLVLVLAAHLLVARRSAALTMVRQRGASLSGIASELLLESLAVAVLATAAGLAVVAVLLGSAGWGGAVPVLLVTATAVPLLGAAAAARGADGRRSPANRSARRALSRAQQLRRLALEVAVLAAAALSVTALLQRGVVDAAGDGGDLTAASAATWWSVAGAVVLLRVLPPLLRLGLALTRRRTGAVGFVAAARLAGTSTPTTAVLTVVTVVAMAGVALALSVTATVRDGQESSALATVGGDARIDTEPDPSVADLAGEVADARGVEAAVAARVEDGVRVSSAGGVEVVRLVVVDTDAYERLLHASALPDAPQLERLAPGDGAVPALAGGDLAGELTLTWDDADIVLTSVGTAPDVDASVDPVVVVDAGAFAAAGATAYPDTIWAVGSGAADAITAVAGGLDADVLTYADERDARRDAPLPSALATLALVSVVLLLALAVVGAVLAAVAGEPDRSRSVGRLRALGLPHRDVRRLLVTELAAPVALAALAGWVLGAACAYALTGSLSLELVTGQSEPPSPVVPLWGAALAAVPVGAVLLVAAAELRAVRRRALATLLRS